MKYSIIVDNDRMSSLLESYPLSKVRREALPALAAMTSDWSYFAARDILPGMDGRRNLAFSPSLGKSRHLTLGECHDVRGIDETHYIETVGPVEDLLSEENLAARVKETERRFHITLSYSTIGDSPEDALQTFFGAVLYPGSMLAQVYEEGVDGVTEIDDAELMAIARQVYPEGSTEEPSGP